MALASAGCVNLIISEQIMHAPKLSAKPSLFKGTR